MFVEYFGFKENPFNLAADPAFFCIDSTTRQVAEQILDNLQADLKPILLTGPLGVGKSQLINHVLGALTEDTLVLHLSDGSITYSERVRLLVRQMSEVAQRNKRLLIIVNNAQEISDHDIKVMLIGANNLATLGVAIQFIFSGLPGLVAKLEDLAPGLFSVSHTRRYQLEGLSLEQVRQYINFRLERAGFCAETQEPIFSEQAVERIATLSKGIPHFINLLCGAALLSACCDGVKQVTENTVQEASLNCLLPVDAESAVVGLPNSTAAPAVNVQQKAHENRPRTFPYAIEMQPSRDSSLAVPPVDPDKFEQAKRKRLTRGLLTLGVSLSFLLGLQYLTTPAQAPYVIGKIESAQTSDKITEPLKTSPVQPVQTINLATAGKKLTDTPAPAELKTAPASAPVTMQKPALIASVPAPKTVATVTARPISKAAVKKDKLLAIHAPLHEPKPVASSTNPVPLPSKSQADKILQAELMRQQLEKEPSFQRVNADLSGIIEVKKEPPAVNRFIDAQELAAKQRANNRLNLDKLGVAYNVESLMNAARTGDVHVLKLLLAGGIPADMKSSQGETALIIASRNGYASAVKLLLKMGAHPNIRDNQGLTALMHANLMNRSEISNLLLSHGASG